MGIPINSSTSTTNQSDQPRQYTLPPPKRVTTQEYQVPPTQESEGRKDDTNKLPWHLLPADAVDEILWVLQYGADKYAARNWEKGMNWSRPFSALMRHMWAWWRREPCDNETGISHLAHAGCCILFLLAYELRKTGTDDRP